MLTGKAVIHLAASIGPWVTGVAGVSLTCMWLGSNDKLPWPLKSVLVDDQRAGGNQSALALPFIPAVNNAIPAVNNAAGADDTSEPASFPALMASRESRAPPSVASQVIPQDVRVPNHAQWVENELPHLVLGPPAAPPSATPIIPSINRSEVPDPAPIVPIEDSPWLTVLQPSGLGSNGAFAPSASPPPDPGQPQVADAVVGPSDTPAPPTPSSSPQNPGPIVQPDQPIQLADPCFSDPTSPSCSVPPTFFVSPTPDPQPSGDILVPEPSSLMLVAAGGIAIGRLRLRYWTSKR